MDLYLKKCVKLSLLTGLTCSATYITRIVGLYTELRADDGFMKKQLYINDWIGEHIIPLNSSLQDHIANIINGYKDVYLGNVITNRSFITFAFSCISCIPILLPSCFHIPHLSPYITYPHPHNHLGIMFRKKSAKNEKRKLITRWWEIKLCMRHSIADSVYFYKCI